MDRNPYVELYNANATIDNLCIERSPRNVPDGPGKGELANEDLIQVGSTINQWIRGTRITEEIEIKLVRKRGTGILSDLFFVLSRQAEKGTIMDQKSTKVTITLNSYELELILERANESLRKYNLELSYLDTIAKIVDEYDGPDREEVLSLLDEMYTDKKGEIEEKIAKLSNAIQKARDSTYPALKKEEQGV